MIQAKGRNGRTKFCDLRATLVLRHSPPPRVERSEKLFCLRREASTISRRQGRSKKVMPCDAILIMACCNGSMSLNLCKDASFHLIIINIDNDFMCRRHSAALGRKSLFCFLACSYSVTSFSSLEKSTKIACLLG